MSNGWKVSAAALVWLLSAGIGFAQEADSPIQKLNWLHGPIIAKIGNQALIKLPEGYSFLDANATKEFLELTQNIAGGDELGMIAPSDMKWFTIFSFDDVGYVKDDEKNSLNATELLKSIREGVAAGNEERQRRGWATMTVTGWMQPPRYNDQTHNLEWSFRGTDTDGSSFANYATKYLGRRGVMRVEVVSAPEGLEPNLATFRNVMTGFSYTPDNDYRAFVKGDKVAEYGLTALIVGGAAAAAVKTGLFKSLGKILIASWKLIAAGVVGLGALLKKIFSAAAPKKPEPQAEV